VYSRTGLTTVYQYKVFQEGGAGPLSGEQANQAALVEQQKRIARKRQKSKVRGSQQLTTVSY
jgi:hypothetical protein